MPDKLNDKSVKTKLIFYIVLALVTLAVFWQVNQYNFVFDDTAYVTGSVPTDCNSYDCGDTVTVKANVNLLRTGYNFSGWNTAADGGGTDRTPLSTFTMTAGDLILYAKWTAWTCGDGIVTTGETCDDANKLNTDACLNSCQSATCSDGYVWSGHEACDDGSNNGEPTSTCTVSCTLITP